MIMLITKRPVTDNLSLAARLFVATLALAGCVDDTDSAGVATGDAATVAMPSSMLDDGVDEVSTIALDPSQQPLDQESLDLLARTTTTCNAPVAPQYYPVRGRHDHGYQSNPDSGATQYWTCNGDHSNSDFVRSSTCSKGNGHYGNDIWAALGTPVVATVSGRIEEKRISTYSGRVVTIKDSCGWYHFSIHLNAFASGISVGQTVVAGRVIGYVGKSGSAANHVIHLHHSVYPGSGNYCRGIDPWPGLHGVESDVCWTPAVCGGRVCGKGQRCSGGSHCCTPGVCSSGCPC